MSGADSPDFQTHIASPGESYYHIAKRYKIDFRELAKINHNAPVKAGMTIRVPMYFLYRVQPNDTVINLSIRFKVRAAEISKANDGLKKLKVNTLIKIPGSIDEVTKNVRESNSASPRQQSPAAEKLSPEMTFVWPVSGTVLESYGEVHNIMNYGLVFRARYSGVVSSADGEILFVGELRGMGKTIFIRHDNEYLSVYSGITQCKYTAGDRVKKGKRIASVKNKVLFFSIFREGEPDDPADYLKDLNS